MTATSDILDLHPETARICELELRQFGGRAVFEGVIATVRCVEDNVVLRQRLGEPGDGRVLVVDGGGSRRTAVLGDMIGALAEANGWAGVVLNACVRDSAELRSLDIGIKALGTCPRPSGKAGEGEVDVPVEFGGVVFEPGAMLYGDDDGVVVLPRTGPTEPS